MSEWAWLPIDAVNAFHDRYLADYGGLEGTRDPGALESALKRPAFRKAYVAPDPDIADLAAMYLLGIVKAHAFLDGNKRTAWGAAYAFLYLNGCDLTFSDADAVGMTLDAATGAIDHAEIATWYRDRLQRI